MDDIRAVITLQRPSNLDTTYCLALLQEEVADSFCKPDGYKASMKGNFKNAAHQHRPPVAEKLGEDKGAVPAQEDKLSTLRAYRRARDLCDHYAEKWVRGHKCVATIQLHAMQEI